MTAHKISELFSKDTAPLENIIKEGRFKLTADLASRILEEAAVPWQRKIEKPHTDLFVDAIRRGTYYPSQVAFGRLNGRLFYVNGYHRASALVEAGGAIDVQILIIDVESEDDLRALYHRFDVLERKRSLTEILQAMKVGEDHDISKGGARSCYQAVGLIINNFRNLHYLNDPIKARSVDKRMDAARTWWPYMVEYERCIQAAPSHVKAKLLRYGCAAVGLVTLRYQPEEAGKFWVGLAENDGLAKGDPRSTLLIDMNTRRLAATASNQAALTAALAWNAYFENRRLAIIKIAQGAKIRIAGTPFDGSRE